MLIMFSRLQGWSVLFCFLVSAQAWAIDFDRYHTQEEINQYLRDLATQYPQMVTHHTLGSSAGGREISYVIFTLGNVSEVPAIYMNGTHHGNEKSSTEAILGLAEFFTENATTVDVRDLLTNYAIYLQPLVNPDGHARHSRYDLEGRDPNRDYSFPERPDNQSFLIPAIQLVKQLADSVKFRAAVAYHSGMEGVLWPWCYTSNRSPDHDIFFTLSKNAALAMGMRLWAQSYHDYPTNGEFIDYVYWAHGTIGLTFEVSSISTPPERSLAQVVERSIAGSMSFLYGIMALDRNALEIESPAASRLASARNATPESTRLE